MSTLPLEHYCHPITQGGDFPLYAKYDTITLPKFFSDLNYCHLCWFFFPLSSPRYKKIFYQCSFFFSFCLKVSCFPFMVEVNSYLTIDFGTLRTFLLKWGEIDKSQIFSSCPKVYQKMHLTLFHTGDGKERYGVLWEPIIKEPYLD